MPELVVARYTENLNWLRNLPTSLTVTVYDKGEGGPTLGGPTFSGSTVNGANSIIPLLNIGREAHTYLHHIVSRYDSLAEWTIFCQGKPFDHAYDIKKTLRAFDGEAQSSEFVWLGHLIDTDDEAGKRLFRPWSKNEDGRGLDLPGFHQVLFDTDGPELYTFVLGAQFIIHRDAIRRQSLNFYERALAVSVTFPDAAHCFERTWDRVFGLTGIDPDWLSGRQTVYLKPMRNQANTTLSNSLEAVKKR